MASQTYVDSVTLTAATEFNRFDTAAYPALSGVAGTNTITAGGPANLTYVATNPVLWFIPAATNTGATTINITPSGGAALGAKNIFANGAACVGGEIVSGVPCAIVYDGTQFNILGLNQTVPVVIVTATSLPSANAVTITDIPVGYRTLILSLSGLSMDTNARVPLVRVSTNNGSSYASTGYQWGAQELGIAASSSQDRIFGTPAMDAADTLDAVCVITGYQAGPFTHASSVGKDSGGNVFIGQGVYLSTSAINALQIIMSDTGNFDAGTYSLYGVR